MPAETKFLYKTPPGVEFIDFHTWVGTLSEDEQLEFNLALARQRAYRQEKIDSGDLILKVDAETGEESYLWKDVEARTINKPTDHIWNVYFNRWLEENQITFEVIDIEIGK